MSAYIVDNKTIDRAVSLWMSDSYGQHPSQDRLQNCEDCDRLGQAMLRLNRHAVLQRYDDPQFADLTDEEIESYRYPLKHVPRIQALKSLQCLIYQCSEGDAMKAELYERMRKMADRTACYIVGQLPEYNDAEWA